jgi:hypothetical protein
MIIQRLAAKSMERDVSTLSAGPDQTSNKGRRFVMVEVHLDEATMLK